MDNAERYERDREAEAVNEQNYLLAEALERESTEDEVRQALELESVLEAARASRRNGNFLMNELRKAGAL